MVFQTKNDETVKGLSWSERTRWGEGQTPGHYGPPGGDRMSPPLFPVLPGLRRDLTCVEYSSIRTRSSVYRTDLRRSRKTGETIFFPLAPRNCVTKTL